MLRALLTIALLTGAVLVYFLGNLIFGIKRNGGCRAVAFVAGSGFAWMGGALVNAIPSRWIQILGMALILFGLYLMIAAVAASNRTLQNVFNKNKPPF